MTNLTNTDAQFSADYTNLKNAALQLEAAINGCQAQESELEQLKKEIEAPISNGESESDLSSRVDLINEYLNANGVDSQGKAKILNDQQTVRADFEACVNDISQNTSSQAADGSGGKQNLINTALDLDQLLGALKDSSGADKGIQVAINGSVGSAEGNSTYQQLDAIRQEIYLGNGDSFDPQISNTTSVIFAPNMTSDPSNPSCVVYQSFADAWAASKTPSGACNANSVLKPISNAFSAIDQNYSSASSEYNVTVQQIYSGLQTLLTVESSFYKSITQTEQSVNQKVAG